MCDVSGVGVVGVGEPGVGGVRVRGFGAWGGGGACGQTFHGQPPSLQPSGGRRGGGVRGRDPRPAAHRLRLLRGFAGGAPAPAGALGRQEREGLGAVLGGVARGRGDGDVEARGEATGTWKLFEVGKASGAALLPGSFSPAAGYTPADRAIPAPTAEIEITKATKGTKDS